jgi:ABC-type nitrate/sulfonate/bicarbonate transport system substrate-binding protein
MHKGHETRLSIRHASGRASPRHRSVDLDTAIVTLNPNRSGEFRLIRHALASFAAAPLLGSAATAQTAMPFALDWKLEGPAAPYFIALDKGYFTAEGLTVEITEGAGSLDVIPKVATGAFPVGFADINGLMKFMDQNPGAPVIAVGPGARVLEIPLAVS